MASLVFALFLIAISNCDDAGLVLDNFQYIAKLSFNQENTYNVLIDPSSIYTWLPYKDDITTRTANKENCNNSACKLTANPQCSAISHLYGIAGVMAEANYNVTFCEKYIAANIMLATYEDYLYTAMITADGVLGLSLEEYNMGAGIVFEGHKAGVLKSPLVSFVHKDKLLYMGYGYIYDDISEKSFNWFNQDKNAKPWTLNMTTFSVKSTKPILEATKVEGIISGLPYIVLPTDQYYIVQSYFMDREEQGCKLTKYGELECKTVSTENLPYIEITMEGGLNITLDSTYFISEKEGMYHVHILMGDTANIYLGTPFLQAVNMVLDYAKSRIGVMNVGSKETSDSKYTWIWISVIIEVVLLVLIFLLCYIVNRKPSMQTTNKEASSLLS